MLVQPSPAVYVQNQFAVPRREVADGSLFGEAVGAQMLKLRGAVFSFVKVQMKVTLVNPIFLDLMFFYPLPYRLKQRYPYYDLTTNIYPRMFGIEPKIEYVCKLKD